MSDPPSEIGIYVGKPKKKNKVAHSACHGRLRASVWAAWMRERVWASVLCVCVFVCARVSLRARAFPCICAILCVHTSSELTQADVHLVDSRNLSSAGYASM